MLNMKEVRRIVVKVGSSTLTYDNGKPNIRRIEQQLSLDRHIVIRSFLQPVFYHCLIPAEHPFSGTRCINQDLVKIRRISFFELIGLFT